MKQTPWGEVSVCDAHVHFFSHKFVTMVASQAGRGVDDVIGSLGWEPPLADPAAFAQTWTAELDKHNITRAAIIASLPGDEPSVSAAVRVFPHRFSGYFIANPLAPGAAANAEQAFDLLGMHGLCLFPAMHGYSLHDDRARALIQIAASRPGTLVFVHCGVLSVGFRKKLGLPSPFDMRFSNPIDVHGVALAFPKLPFVIPHFGAGFLREALMVADLCPNVYLDTSSSNSWRKYLEYPLTMTQVFERALAICGPERLLFGTDSSFFPRGWNSPVFDDQVLAMAAAGVSESAARAILGGNLERLLQRPA